MGQIIIKEKDWIKRIYAFTCLDFNLKGKEIA